MPERKLHTFRSAAFVGLVLLLVYVYVFPINFYIRSTNSAWQSAAYEERDAGQWLYENGRKKPRIFSASFRPVFYSRGSHIFTEEEQHDQIIKFIEESNVDYVVDSERLYKKHSHLREFGKTLRTNPNLELIYHRNDQPGYAISIYLFDKGSATKRSKK